QLLVASWIAQSWTVMLYLPIMSLFGILAGITIGISGNYLLVHVQALKKFQLNYELEKKNKKRFGGYQK
ncbi:MAG: Gx transporter family protein, partial [Enterococcus sp.]